MRKVYNSPKFMLTLYKQEDIIRTSDGETESIAPSPFDPNELPPVFIS